jgi:hypothetical protein
MADKYSILGQVVLNNVTDDTEIYQVPEAASSSVTQGSNTIVFSPKAISDQTQTLLTTLYVCTTTANSRTIEITVIKNSTVPFTTKLLTGRALTDNQTDIFTLNLTLASGDALNAQISDSGAVVDVTAFGIEMITGVGPNA